MTTTPLTPNKNNGGEKLLIAAFFLLALVPLVSAAPIYPTVNASFLSYYKFDQNASGENATNIYDHAGGKYNGTLVVTPNGMNLTNLGFAGTGAITSYGNNTNNTRVSNVLNLSGSSTTAITFGGWINASSFINGAGIISWRGTSMGLTQTASAYRCGISNVSTDTGQTATSSAVSTGQYHLVVCTYDGTNVRIYVDGAKAATSTAMSGAINYSTYSSSFGAWVGRAKGGSELVANASIDEVFVINSSMTDAEIWSMYQNYNGGCVNATDGMIIQGGTPSSPTYTKICELSYNLTGDPTNGAIRFGGDNAVLNITNVNMTGNFSCTTCIGILTNTKSNVTIIGNQATTKLNGYGYSIQIDGSGTGTGSQNILVDGINFASQSNNSVTWRFFSNGIIMNATVKNSLFNFTGGNNYLKYVLSTPVVYSNITYDRDQFISTTATTTLALTVNGTRNFTVTDSSFIGPNTLSSVGLNLHPQASNISDINLIRTNFTGYNNQILLSTPQLGNVQIDGVLGVDTDTCLNMGHTTLPSVVNITCINATSDLDNFNLAVRLYNISNVNFTWLNVTNYGSWALWGQKTANIRILNFSVNGIAMSNRPNYLANDLNDPNGAFRFTTLFKSWITNQNELRYNGTEIGMEPLESYNVTIGNGTYGSNVQVLLWTQGGGNITATLPAYWHSSFDAPTYLTDTNELFVNNLFDNLTRYSLGATSVLQFGYKARYFFNYTIARNYSWYKNINTTGPENATFNNLTGSLVYIANGAVICSPTVACHNVTYLIPQYNTSYVLNTYNVTQGITRDFDPVAVASPSSNVRSLTSSLTGTIANVSVTLSTSGIVPSSPLLVHPDGSSEYPSYLYDSVSETITFNATIMSGVSTLRISPQNAQQQSICRNGTGALGELGGWLPIIALVIGAAIVLGILSGGFGIGIPTPEFNLNNLPSIALLIVFTVTTIAIASTVLTAIIC